MAIGQFLKSIGKNVWVVIIMMAILVGGGIYISKLRTENENLIFNNTISNNNHLAMVDSIHKSLNKKTKQYEFEKRTLVLKRDELANDTSRLAREINKLNGNVQYYSSLVSILKGKIGDMQSDINYNDSIITVKWNSFTKEKGFEQYLNGETVIDYYLDSINKFTVVSEKTNLTDNSMLIGLNIRQEDAEYNGKKSWKIIVSSPSERFSVDSISSVYFIDKQSVLPGKKPSPWSFGPSIGYGINKSGKLDYNIGLSVQYNLLQIFKSKY